MDVGVVLLVVLAQGVDDPAWFLGGSGVIQVDQLLLTYPTLQDGEVRPNLIHVVHDYVLRPFPPPSFTRFGFSAT